MENQPQIAATKSQFILFYLWFMIIASLIALAPTLLWGFTDNDPVANSGLVMTLGIIQGLLGFMMFVLSIVAIIMIITKHQTKRLLALPLTYFGLVLIGFVVGIFMTAQNLMKVSDQLGSSNPTPEQISEVTASFAELPPVILWFGIIRALVLIVVAGWLVIKERR